MNPQKGWAAASPPPTPFGGGYGICRSAWVMLCVGVQVPSVWCPNSYFENVTPYISGQPFCSMSMEALEMLENTEHKYLAYRLAKSGGALG